MKEETLRTEPAACQCCDAAPGRRDFFARASCVAVAALVASGVSAGQGAERSYALPTEDGVNIDQDNDVILVRNANRIYAFALSCPHENTALRWRRQDQRFQCPRHESKYQPDGAFLSGRATRNMDRFAIRRDGQKVVVNLAQLFRSDRQKPEWEAAAVTL